MALGPIGQATNGVFASSITISVPGTVANGHLMFFVLNVLSSTATVTSGPAGWTLVDSRLNGVLRTYVWTKIANSEPASYSASLSGSTFAMGAIGAWSVDGYATPVTDYDIAVAVDATRISSVAVSTAADNGGVIHYLAMRDSSGTGSWGDQAGVSEVLDHAYSSARLASFYKAIPTAGSSGVDTFIEPGENFNYDSLTVFSFAVDIAAPAGNGGGGESSLVGPAQRLLLLRR